MILCDRGVGGTMVSDGEDVHSRFDDIERIPRVGEGLAIAL